MPRHKQPLTAKQEKFIRMSARGCTRREILREVYGLDVDTSPPNEIASKDVQMCRWRKLPEFDEVKQVLIGSTAAAIKTLRNQITSDNPWVGNKASNDILNFGKQMIFGDEEKTVNVNITGMPEIGSPDSSEDDV